MKLSFLKFFVLALCFCFSLNVFGEYDRRFCFGTAESIYVDKNANLYLDGTWSNYWSRICNLESSSPWKGISKNLCKEWYSMLQVAVVSKSPLFVYYSSAPTCDSLPGGSDSIPPHYIMLRD